MMGAEQKKGDVLCVGCLWNRVGRRAAWVAHVTDGCILWANSRNS